MILFDHRFWTVVEALLPVIIAVLAMFGVASLAVNGGLGGWMLIDRIQLRRRARATRCTIDDLMDGDDWARANGYAQPAIEPSEPRPVMPPALAAHIAHELSADVDAEWADICRATEGDDAA